MPRFPLVRTLSIAALGLGAAMAARWFWGQRMPAEYQTLEAVVARLSQANDLGSQPLGFSITSGDYSAVLAAQRGLCKGNQCEFFAQLNPYHHYSNGWDELVRQGYVMGDIQGWSTSSGTVLIPRTTFRAYGPRIGYLSCTVAHEIAHIQRHHIFEQSYYDSHALHDLQPDQKQTKSLAQSRQQELEADRDAADMMARAGYKGRICLDDLLFMHHSVGDGSRTEADSTHPGFEERMAALKAHYGRREREAAKGPSQRKGHGTAGSFRYDSSDNLLVFSPSQH